MDSIIVPHLHLARWSGTALVAAAMLCISSGPRPQASGLRLHASGLSPQSAAQQKPSGSDVVARGRYLVGITGCHDCHSPKIKGMTPNLDLALSGRPATTQLPSPTKDEVHASPDLTAWTGPWGYSVASNLTPDEATGIGKRYTEASFVATMRTGKKPNGTAVMPPMPAEVYQNMTDEDLRAIFAYLRTIKPIRNAVLAGLTPPASPQKPAGAQK